MSGMSTCWGWFLGIAISSTIALWANCADSQITPDGTLPNNSIVTPDGNTLNITGGTQAGSNLFHSFQQFSVPTGGAAIFNNAVDIQNIISRVTSKSVSNIDGLIKANGTANLFLINPSGIIFGRDASLNIGGSFVATTANAIGFGNQGFFSATVPNNPSLLTVNPSAFFFNQIATAPIQNNSVAPARLNSSETFTPRGLRVPNGHSLLLVGGNIRMDNGRLNAFGGRVELGGVSGAGTVGLNGNGNNLSLSFPNSVERSDVSLSNGAQVDVIASDGGSITVNARNLEMTGESFLLAGIESGLGSSNSKAGNIEVNATVAINLDNSSIANLVLPEASGQGGDVNISASTLQVEGGAQVSTSTRGVGKGGNLTVDAQNVQVIGELADGRSSGLFASAQSTGYAGDLTIKTNTLLVKDGAQVSTATFGAGNGGNLTVNTKELLVQDGAQVDASTDGGGKGGNLTVTANKVQLVGRSADDKFASGIGAVASQSATGDAGNLTIKTGELLIWDGAQVSVNTLGRGRAGNLTVIADKVHLIGSRTIKGQFVSGLGAQSRLGATGDAGNLTINTGELLIQNGAQVNAVTFGGGKGGNLTVTADKVHLIGTTPDGLFPSGLSTETQGAGDAGDLTVNAGELLVKDGAQVGAGTFGSGNGGNLTVNAQDVQLIGRSADDRAGSGLFASAQPNSTGDAGDLTIKTNTLLVRDGAAVTVQSLGTGTAGNMTVNARSIRLDNLAFLDANTQSAKVDLTREQATININSRDLIMRRGSNIRTNATGENVIGGNINIDTDFLVAVENSDISANSTNFRGGNVRINAQGIFGAQFRDVASDQTSDITATGASPEFNGNVEIIEPDIDPNSGLVELPTIPVDTEVTQACTAGGNVAKSNFIVTGRGGLPSTPGASLSTDAVQVDLVTLNRNSNNRSTPTVTNKPTAPAPAPIVEATGWVKNAKGEVVLTANALTTTPHSPWSNPTSCTTSRS